MVLHRVSGLNKYLLAGERKDMKEDREREGRGLRVIYELGLLCYWEKINSGFNHQHSFITSNDVFPL